MSDLNNVIAKVVGWSLAGICIFMGAIALAAGVWKLKQQRASESWPTASATIVDSGIAKVKKERRGSNGRKRMSDTDYVVEVRYAYEVGGRPYEGDRIRFGTKDYDNRSLATKALKQYPKGKKVQAYYDPEKPTRSVLIREVNQRLVQIIAPLIFLSIGLITLFFMVRSTLQKSKEKAAPPLSL